MKKILLLAVFLTIQFLGLEAFATNTKLSCTPTITTGTISPSTICAGSIIGVPFAITDCVDPGNVFTVQLSDASGSFASPINIGSAAGTSAGTIVAIIPPTTTFGSGYRIRVISSSPVTIGTDNGVDLVLLPKPSATFSINNTVQCINGNSFIYTNTSTGSITNYNWKLGDGIATTQTNVVYSYATAGTFNVMLTATGTNGCKDSATQAVTVQPKPVADFSYTGPNLCSAPDFNFTNTTASAGTLTSHWYFGDGDTSTSTNPNHTFAAAGTYSVKLIVQGTNGCIDSITKTISVLDKPTASFLVNNATQCLSGNNFSFPNFSTGVGNSYLWQFGDGTTSTVINATKTYASIGTYTVKLIVTNINGCKDSLTQNVDVTSSPVVSFTTGNTLCSIGLNVVFNNGSNGANSYNWSFGDGTFSTNTNPSKTYTTAGTYNVKLVATGSGGCKDSVTQSIVVNTKASADFSINNNTQCVNSNLFTFTNNTSGVANTYNWSFGDGITSTLTSPSKAYTVAGNYVVKLIVTNANGCVDSISKNITVADKPTPNFTVAGNTSCSSTLNVSMTNTSTGVGNTYVWDFGDGTNSTLVNPGKTYSSTGSYVIRLVATNFAGCKDSTERSLTFATKPTASFTVNSNSQCTVSNTFTFTNNSVGGSTYNWSFGDGFTSTATNPTKQYSSAGTYTVKLVVTNASGCKDSITQVVSVLAKPTADFTISGGTGCSSNLTVQLINLSSGSTPSYSWDFGDGTTSTSTNPSKTYANVGTYTIKLVVTNGNGCKDSISVNFTLSAKPIVNFTINNSNQCENTNLFTFTNTTTGATTYNWSFGDGFTSTATNPTKQYITTGTYTVKLVATNTNGCVDSISKTVTVVPKPSAGFTMSGATGCTNNRTISLTNTSTGTGNTYSWDFGDGTTSTSTNPVANYAAAGTYTIKLVVTNVNGCKDSTSQIITFNAFPVAAISLASGTNATQCKNANSFVFNGSPASGVTYSWDFDDFNGASSSSTLANPTKVYGSAGIYNVKLVVTNAAGCTDNTSTNVTVNTSPQAAFTMSGATGCTSNRTISFTNFSNNAGLFLWSFGDNTGVGSVSPSKIYAAPAGTYNVQLMAINANGCRDSVTQIVSFKSVPTAGIAFAGNTTQCVNSNAFLLFDNSTGGSTYNWDYGDGNTAPFKNPSVFVYTVAGNYAIKHTATSSDGCSDVATLNVNILAAPIPNFTISGLNSCGNNLPITFTNTSTGTGNTYLWRFGDGTTSTATSPTKTYTVTGSYNVRLIVTSANGCADSVTQIVQFAPKVTAGFIAYQSSGNPFMIGPLGAGFTQCFKNHGYGFSDNTSNANGSTTYLWEFGDGTISTERNPSGYKVYAAPGTYKLKLTATNANGCIDSITSPITVLGNPVPNFTINGGGCTSSLSINLTNSSVPATGSGFYEWNFGDGSPLSNTVSPTKLYAAKGTYQIRLIAFDLYCKDTLIKPVSFYQVPAVGINFASNHTQCLNGNSYTVSNNSFFTTSYLWRFGDGTTSTSPTPPAKTYTAAGNYIIKLIGTTIDGCKDSTTETATVIANPNAAFTATYQTCGNTNVRFVQIDSSTTAFSAWYFGDGNGPSDVFSANHTYATRGSYIAKYFAYDATFTCVDSATQIVTFAPLPVAVITHLSTTNLTQCANGNSFKFFDGSVNAATYLWNFGDGTTSTLQDPPAHSYTSSGNYTIKLVITSAAGCKDSTTQSVTVNPSPDASFSLGYNACTFTAQFYQLAITNTTTSVWDFGDGSGVNAAIPAVLTHTYPGAGTYILKHFATSVNGCIDSSSVTLTATPKPIAAINSAGINLTQCLNSNSFTFVNNSTTATAYTWHFGDGDSSTATTPTHHYTTAGTYTVKLFASTITGCKDSTTLVVTVLPSPQAAFVPTYNECGLSAQFVQTTTAITAFGVWNFGDGNIVNGGTPQNHTYPSIGTYTVKHFVYDASSTCSDSAIQTVTFFATPVAGIGLGSASSQCLNSNNFLFTDNSTNATTHSWNFGDGTTSTLANPPSHTYVTAGVYTVKHVAYNSSCKDSIVIVINVLASPDATFTANYTACNNLTAQFAQTNTANTLSSTWNFGDGNSTTNVTSASHTYPSIGSYIVKYVAHNSICADSSTQTITFTTAPVAGINSSSLSTQCLNTNSFVFDDNSLNATTHFWSFGDGTTSTLANPPSHTYTAAGTYTVKQVVTNASACKDSATITVFVRANPNATFNAAVHSCDFNAIFGQINPANTANSVWYFGDGNATINATNTSHTYTASGVYTVKLVAYDATFTCGDSTTQIVTLNTKPIAGITSSSLSSQCLNGNSFTFTDNSTNATTHSWSFGDGSTSTLTNPPTHSYVASGTYTVKLVVTNISGCADSTTVTVNVVAKPVAAFTTNGSTSCTSNLTVSTTNTSTNATSYVWSFGDGNTSVLTNPTHTYTVSGTYTIKLVATNATGCKDSISQTITISAKPIAAFTVTALTQCLTGGTLQFTDASIGTVTPSYYYDFGDGTISFLQNPTKAYLAAGTYIVKQIVTNANGCKDSITHAIVVDVKPVATFNIPNFTTCTNTNSVTFANTSTNATNYVWSFGDGVDSTSTNPTHTYTALGTYTIKLVAANTSGCKDSTTKTITLTAKPTAGITSAVGQNSTQCLTNNSFTFSDNSIGATTHSWSFGDGGTSTLASPLQHSYINAGVYVVKQVVTNIGGCKDSTSLTVTVLAAPVASFSLIGATSCTANTSITTNNTTTGLNNVYAWDLGDGNTSLVTNPSHTYTVAGTYNIKLVATNSITGCKDSVTNPVTFSTNPTAAFTINNSNQCVNSNSFVFTNTSVGGATYSWNFGDATTSSLTSPNKVFTAAGVYSVKLIVTTSNGCKDSVTQVVTVLAKPTPSFNVVGITACSSNLTITLNNTTPTAVGTTYVWSFGDGTNSIAANPSKTYSSIGTYTIKLVVSNGNGCVDSISQNITISTKPTAAFTVSDTLQCVNGTAIVFTDASINTVTPAYYYDFGDGTFSLLQNPTKTYTTAGTYIVKMFVTNTNGCKDSTTKTIRIVAKPIASFTIPNYSSCSNANTSFSFVNTSTNGITYAWDFGDGTTSTLTNPTKTYTIAGTFIVKLVVSNANGCKDSSTQTISFIAKPIAGYTYTSSGLCSNNTFTFTDTSKVAGTPSYYYWDFGDGTFSLLQNPTKAFTTAGIYKVLLFVTNANGCKDSTSKTIVVAAKPTAAFTIANYTSCSNNNTLSFVNASTNAISYVWSFGDGVDSTSKNPTHTYASFGTYVVKLVAANASGCKDSATQTINLITKPIAAFSVASTGTCTNNTFTFIDASTISGTTAYYYWDFGDGTFSLQQNPTKIFATSGTYKIILFVTNTNGCKDSLSKQVTVVAAPKAAFTLSNFNPCSNNYTVTTVNASTNSTSYFWDFGDGILTSQTNITKTFAGNGTYTITLIATNANGCTDTARQTISFTTKPIAAFNVSSLGGCVNNSFSFSDNSTVSGTPSYYYNFGDGVTSLLPNTTHTYSVAGTYKVIYVVTNSNGCKDSTNQTLIVTAKPKAAFTTPNVGGCSNNNSFSFTNNSTNAANYIWDFGDGTGATTTNATKTYAGTGTFIVKLIAISATGCSDTTSQTFTIIPKPIASFNVSSLGGCINNTFSFADNSSVSGVATYFYDFGDATISLLPNPTHTYTAVGTYKVMFFVTNSNGCKDSTSRVITVTTKPTASFSLSGLSPCTSNNTITLVNSSTNATSYVWNFGDGNGSTVTNPTKTYTAIGTYKITLFATNANGCVDSTSQTITLTSKPTAAFSVSSTSQCLTSNSFVFASVSTGNITSLVWNFGDGTNSSVSNPTKTYTAQGIYTVTLTVTNANGCTDVATQVVNVTGKPVITYTINSATQCILSNVFTFTNTSPNQTGVTYFWNFGDGILSSLNTISKVYTSTGTFTVSLIAVNANGCIDSLVKTVSVLAKPAPSFNLSSSVQCVNNSFVFTNTTTGTVTNYIWRFGDGTTSTSTSPTHSYTVGGTYIVTLIASNAGGCIDSTSKTIFVTAKPVASFTTAIKNICTDPTTVTFNNTTTGSFSSLIWAFSDGTISTDISPVKTFATAGTYTAKLLVLSNGGCRDSISQSFTILPKLSAVFSFNSIAQCINNNSFTFTNATINTGLNSYTYKWDLGDGTLASTSAVTKSYLLPGNYTVKLLIVNNTTGCRDSVSQVVSVNAQPTATLSGNGTICQGNSFVINTTFTGTPPFSFTYTDGTSNYFVSNVTTNLYGLGVSPLATSTYTIISMNDAYCSASTAQVTSTKSVVIVDTAKFTTQPISKASCVGNTVLFTTKVSTNALVTYQWQKNGVDIIGANSDSLKLTNISSLDSGTYRLVVVLPCGSIYSSNAILVVNQAALPPVYTAAVKYCQLDTAKPLVAVGNILTWYSVATGGLGTSITPTPNTLAVGTQTYWVSNNNSTNCESARYPVTITILPKPTVTLVAIGNTELQPTQTVLLKATASANALGIRWYYNDLPIGTLPSNQNLVGFNGIGRYQVDAVTVDGCTARSEVIQVTGPSGLAASSQGNNLRLYPNPATSVINMYFDNPINQDATVRLVTATGQILQSKAVKFTNRFQPVQFNIASLRADVYAIEVISAKGATIARNLFIKAR